MVIGLILELNKGKKTCLLWRKWFCLLPFFLIEMWKLLWVWTLNCGWSVCDSAFCGYNKIDGKNSIFTEKKLLQQQQIHIWMRERKESEIIYYLACSPVTRPNLWYQIINYLRKEDGDAVNIHYKLCNAMRTLCC